jgi:hypothetical protein
VVPARSRPGGPNFQKSVPQQFDECMKYAERSKWIQEAARR